MFYFKKRNSSFQVVLMESLQPTQSLVWWDYTPTAVRGLLLAGKKRLLMGVCLAMRFVQLHCELCLQLPKLCLVFPSLLQVEQTVLKQCCSFFIAVPLQCRYQLVHISFDDAVVDGRQLCASADWGFEHPGVSTARWTPLPENANPGNPVESLFAEREEAVTHHTDKSLIKRRGDNLISFNLSLVRKTVVKHGDFFETHFPITHPTVAPILYPLHPSHIIILHPYFPTTPNSRSTSIPSSALPHLLLHPPRPNSPTTPTPIPIFIPIPVPTYLVPLH